MITSLRLQHFRSYVDESFEIEPGINIVVGPNASGKTNLLEGVLVAATGKSYRAHDNQLLRTGDDWARIDAQTLTGTRSVKIESIGEQTAKSYIIDDKPYKRLSLLQTQPVVLFEPNDLLLLSNEPRLRRQFLDRHLEQLVPGFGSLKQDYRRTLHQRNSLLKRGLGSAQKQLFAWNIRLSELGGQIAAHRLALIEDINQTLKDVYTSIAKQKTDVMIVYKPSVSPDNYSSNLLRALEKNLDKDILRGYTSTGPHREDFSVLIAGKEAGDVASRGEVRTLLLALKIIELRLLEAKRGTKPILLLDDVFSELDGARRKALTQFLSEYQTFITTTDADIAIDHFSNQCNIIAINP